MIEFEIISESLHKYLSTAQELEDFILLLENKSYWENAQKKQPVLFSELMQMYAAKYATEATVESFIRYKTSLESGVLSQSSRLKMGDNSRLYLGSKAAKLANTHVPIAVHFRNQMRWRASGSLKNCARKQPLVLEEFARKKREGTKVNEDCLIDTPLGNEKSMFNVILVY